MRDAVRDKLVTIKTINYRDVDRETAKKKLWDTSRREAKRTPPRSSKILSFDYKLICQIMDELRREGRLAVL